MEMEVQGLTRHGDSVRLRTVGFVSRSRGRKLVVLGKTQTYKHAPFGRFQKCKLLPTLKAKRTHIPVLVSGVQLAQRPGSPSSDPHQDAS